MRTVLTKSQEKLLGKVPDREIAQELGVSIATVIRARQARGIVAHRKTLPKLVKSVNKPVDRGASGVVDCPSK